MSNITGLQGRGRLPLVRVAIAAQDAVAEHFPALISTRFEGRVLYFDWAHEADSAAAEGPAMEWRQYNRAKVGGAPIRWPHGSFADWLSAALATRTAERIHGVRRWGEGEARSWAPRVYSSWWDWTQRSPFVAYNGATWLHVAQRIRVLADLAMPWPAGATAQHLGDIPNWVLDTSQAIPEAPEWWLRTQPPQRPATATTGGDNV